MSASSPAPGPSRLDELSCLESMRRGDPSCLGGPPSLRAAFLLRDVEGLSTAEAAEALSVTEASLKVRLHRARLLLRERLSAFVVGRGKPPGGRA